MDEMTCLRTRRKDVYKRQVLLLGLAGKEALSHQRTYSPVEKRELQTRPEISITKVLDGRFQKKYESYLRDQFPGRDHWVSFQTDMELFMGKNEIHNVYIGKNHYLLEHYTEKEFDPQQISKNLQALEKFVGKTKQNADVHAVSYTHLQKTERQTSILPITDVLQICVMRYCLEVERSSCQKHLK